MINNQQEPSDPAYLAAKSIAERYGIKYVRQYAVEGYPRYAPTYDRVGLIVWTNSAVDMMGKSIKR